ncbi:MAG: type II secretion system F family protein [Candidatus Kaiserbacteria bacterium]|nr:type II secretion system F family protein [Candidatus Kaiserbacteria bacterium]
MIFIYTVVDKEGEELSGQLEATSRTNAITLLHERGYTVLSLEHESKSALEINVFEKVRKKDLVIFSRQIATLFEAEISALQAFSLVSENVQNKYFQGILVDIAKSIEQGLSVEKALLKHHNVFSEFFISIVAIGEQSGTLPRSFSYLADHLDRSADTSAKMRKALTYPIFVIVMFFLVMVLIMVTVIPQISTILTQSGAELPLITRIVVAVSDFLKHNIVLLLVTFFGSGFGLVYYSQTEDGRKALDRFLVNFPLLRGMFREYFLVRFSRNLGVMLGSGVPIVTALQILSRGMVNTVYQEVVREMSVEVRQGVKLSETIARREYLGSNVAQIIRVGEEAGELQRILETIADLYEKQLRNTIDTALDLIQPTIIVFLGLGVGLLIGAVIIPIYSISSQV